MVPVPLLRSSLIPAPFVHGFTTRRGGVSVGPFASLNLGRKWGDDPAHVAENRQRIYVAGGFENLYSVNQVHGAGVVVVSHANSVEGVSTTDADAICSASPELAVGVYTADCLPILLADPQTGAFAAVHAGWRGTVAQVVPAAVQKMVETFGSNPGQLLAAIGPGINACCFVVGDDVASQFQPEFINRERHNKQTVDLRAANRKALRTAGLSENHIDGGFPCTACNVDRFYSFRRDGGRTGQHLSFIWSRMASSEKT